MEAGELAIFEPSNNAIDIHAKTDADFVLGSAAPHTHDLVLGKYSVHTSRATLRAVSGESTRSDNGYRTMGDFEMSRQRRRRISLTEVRAIVEGFMLRIAIIIGSTRPGRKGEAVAKWAYEIAHTRNDAEFELVESKTSISRSWTNPCRPAWGNTRTIIREMVAEDCFL